jgi:hypothetical protein
LMTGEDVIDAFELTNTTTHADIFATVSTFVAIHDSVYDDDDDDSNYDDVVVAVDDGYTVELMMVMMVID